jgi:IMP cyclohydrolase
MYLGRFLVAGPTVGAYRVSSRSFPNREAVRRDDTVTVRPTADAEPTDNPYVEYNAARVTDRGAVIGNGSHVDPIAEKLALGTPARDALATPLQAMDFEKDDYDTPRIAAVVGVTPADPTTGVDGPGALVGIVRRDALLVEAVGEPTIVSTYEKDAPESHALDATGAQAAAQEVYDLEFEHTVCAAGVAGTASEGFGVATYNG